ncbi:MAG: hypothetical protein NTV94_07410 [Planctomycetota bacterium]|nr:hypothetical protein [Planctomycetota bacterium]
MTTADEHDAIALAGHASDPESIHAAYMVRGELTGGWFWNTAFIWASAAYCSYIIVRLLLRAMGVDPHFAELAAAVGLIMWAISRQRRWRASPDGPSWARARNGLASDPSQRLRLVGEGATINRIAAQIEAVGDRFSEPLITRCAIGISVADDRVDSLGKARPGYTNLLSRTTRMVHLDLSTAQKFVGIIGAIGSIAAILIGTTHLFGAVQPFGPFIGFTGVTGGIAILSALCPTYIRVAPGSLDVLRFGWIGRNIPRFEHFDLRTCQVLVDSRSGMIRIWDEARPTRRGIFINASLTGAGKQELSKAILAAARSKIPTPTLPDDALVG